MIGLGEDGGNGVHAVFASRLLINIKPTPVIDATNTLSPIQIDACGHFGLS